MAAPLSLILGIAVVLAAGPALAGDLAVTVGNTYEVLGDIRIAIYDSPDAFEADGPPVAAMVMRLSQPQARMTVGPLPQGRYAVRVFQDINRNGKIDRNMLGIPSEPFGFSNDAMGSMGPPSFDQAAVTVGEGTTGIAIRLNR